MNESTSTADCTAYSKADVVAFLQVTTIRDVTTKSPARLLMIMLELNMLSLRGSTSKRP